MRLIGFIRDGAPQIGRLEDDKVHSFGPTDAFYAGGCDLADRDAMEVISVNDLTPAPFMPLTSRIFCVGINYRSHAEESKTVAGLDVPKLPMIFGRWAQSLVVDGANVPVPPNEPGLDWEVELAVVIKDEVWEANPGSALDHVLGYTAFNDLSARRKQLQTPQFTLGKNSDFSGPIGPVLVTPDSVGDPDSLRVTTEVNGELMQDANTADLIHSVQDIIAYITDTVTLLPGDVIATGTPGGVGVGMTPQRFLTPGDVVRVEVENIGSLTNHIVHRRELTVE